LTEEESYQNFGENKYYCFKQTCISKMSWFAPNVQKGKKQSLNH